MTAPESFALPVRSIGRAIGDSKFCRVVLSPKARKGLDGLHHFDHVYLFSDAGGAPEIHLCRILSIDEQKGRLLLYPALPCAPMPVFDLKPYFPVNDRVSHPIVNGIDPDEWFPEPAGPLPDTESLSWECPEADGSLTAQWESIGTFESRGSRGIVRFREDAHERAGEAEGYSHIKVVWAFSRFADDRYRDTYRVRPPYPATPTVGVFASRSPVRPNPVAMTTVRVVSVDAGKGEIEIDGMDAFPGSPVLCLVPYRPDRERVRSPRVPPWASHWPDWFSERQRQGNASVGEWRESHVSALRRIIGEEPEAPGDAALFWQDVRKAEKKEEGDDFIRITGARQNNLKDVSLAIPKNRLTVITGMSGSGKSSLAFDTLFAESQRRFVDTLSTLGRQAFGDVERPDVEGISGLPYAVAIEQKSIGRNARSTVGTITEIFDFLRLLYSRVAKRYCPDCGEEIAILDPEELTDTLVRLADRSDFTVLDRKTKRLLLTVGKGDTLSRESVREAAKEADYAVLVRLGHAAGTAVPGDVPGTELTLSSHPLCPQCGRLFFPMTSSYFSFNHPDGMCPGCKGLGRLLEIDPDKIVTRPELSLLDGASPWWGDLRSVIRNPTMNWMRTETIALAAHMDVDLELPWKDLPGEFRDKALYGTGEEKLTYRYNSKTTGRSGVTERPAYGAVNHLKRLFEDRSGGTAQPMWLRFMTDKECPACHGERLGPEGRAARLAGLRYPEVARKSISAFIEWIEELPGRLDRRALSLAGDLLVEIRRRCRLLADTGLTYLSLDRPSSTLSGGEAQRIRLAGQLGCGLNNLLYVLDEPSIGLHPRDHEKMLATMRGLRDEGNTVVVVEHDADTMRAADFLVDMGPGAGAYGGEIVASGTPPEITRHPSSLTGAYLSGKKRILPDGYRPNLEPCGWLHVRGANKNNLKGVSVSIPLGSITAVTGVSGSGKSSLVHQVLSPSLEALIKDRATRPCSCESLEGTEGIDKMILVDQAPIGRTPRSNPASYTGLWDGVRLLFASTPDAKLRGYGPNVFSFNNKEGACPVCSGDGRMRTEMHFMPDIWSICPLCRGRRFREETLEVRWNGKTVADILDMEISDAVALLSGQKKVHRILKTLADVGLGYLRLGQSALDLSGGEAQRVKLARELCRPDTGRTLYILDEPTTGLHFEDIRHLLDLLGRLKDGGNTVLLVEHNLDVIAAADYVIDLGPEGGEAGGRVVVQGTVEQVMATPESHTGQYLKKHRNIS
jgi:excinuclease ABC subunit A